MTLSFSQLNAPFLPKQLGLLIKATSFSIIGVALTACNGDNDSTTSLDKNAPVLTVTSNFDKSITNQASFTIAGSAIDENTTTITVKSTTTGQSKTVNVGNDGKFNVAIPLISGNNDIVITATDEAGNTVSKEGTILLDNVAPNLSINSDTTEGVSRTTVYKVKGKLSDNSELATLKLTVKNGTTEQPITLAQDGSFDTDITLQLGSNNLILTATDTAGNNTTKQTNIYFGQVVAAGNSHTGAIVNGKLYAWGRNNFGQVGNGQITTLEGNTNHPITPYLVTTAPTNLSSVIFNQNHSTLLTNDGKVYTWGDDRFGQLGRGSLGRSSCASSTDNCRLDIGEVAGLPKAMMVASGYRHQLVLTEEGSVYAFGQNSNGQLGNGTTANSDIPVKVDFSQTTASKIIQVVASSNSSYALDDKGQIWAWGLNQYANLGQGTTCLPIDKCVDVTSKPLLVKSPEGIKFVEISAGKDHALAIDNNGKLYGWGLNSSSQIGYLGNDVKNTDKAWSQYITVPTALPWSATRQAKHIYANGNTSFVLASDNNAYHWGMYGETGADGKTAYTNLSEPTNKIPNLTQVTDMAVGGLHQIAKRQDGGIFTWGWSFEGSLGGGETTTNIWMYNTPISVKLN